MSTLASLYHQFQQPSGVPGYLAGWIMAHRGSNQKRNRWTVDLLNIQPTDQVLEIGFGPGLAIAWVSRQLSSGRVIGIDHSAIMLDQALRRNQSAVKQGLVQLKLGGVEILREFPGRFNKIYSANLLQFFPSHEETLHLIRAAMRPGGILATTYQPRHRGAKPDDAFRFADRLSGEIAQLGFHSVRTEVLPLTPIPAVCVLGQV